MHFDTGFSFTAVSVRVPDRGKDPGSFHRSVQTAPTGSGPFECTRKRDAARDGDGPMASLQRLFGGSSSMEDGL